MQLGDVMSVKSALARFPAAHRLIYKIMYRLFDKQLTWGETLDSDKSVFNDIFETNGWGSDESLSGRGSTLQATAMIRKNLPRLIAKYEINSILDAPCGDFNWMSKVDLPDVTSYVGGDIVQGLVDMAGVKYASERRKFQYLDILSTPLPKADLWLCRETLFHFPTDCIIKVLERFRDSEISYLLTTTFDFPTSNPNIAMGNFRMLNLRIAPFSLPKPIDYLDDFTFPEAPRRLGLWSRDQLKGWTASV